MMLEKNVYLEGFLLIFLDNIFSPPQKPILSESHKNSFTFEYRT